MSLLALPELIKFPPLLDSVLVDVDDGDDNLILQIAAFDLQFTQGLICAFGNLCTASTCIGSDKRSTK